MLKKYEVLQAFRKDFARPEFSLYRPASARLSARVDQFVKVVQQHWASSDVHWVKWSQSNVGRDMLASPRLVARATPLQLVQLFTTLVRAERSSTEFIESAFHRGLVTAMLDRAADLAHEDKGGPLAPEGPAIASGGPAVGSPSAASMRTR